MDFNVICDKFKTPSSDTKIYKDECSFSLDSPESRHGLYICLNNFIAIGHDYFERYAKMTGNSVFLNYRITKNFKKTKPEEISQNKPTKLALGVEGGFELPTDKYDVIEHWELVIPNQKSIPLSTPKSDQAATDISHLSKIEGLPTQLAKCITFVQLAECAILAEERAGAAALWEASNERPISKFAKDLKQLSNGVKIKPSGWKCCKCDMKENLWLNMSDGSILCGRRFFDGSGGNNHAVEHYESTKYPLAVKLGTITPAGAEVHSYAEDDMVTDPYLAEHLRHWGIDIMKMEKTDKTIAELEIAANERLGEWLLLQESNKVLEGRFGPGLTGLRNLGNSCYINSIIQVLFTSEQFRWRYAYNKDFYIDLAMSQVSQQLPIDDIGLQLSKVGYGLCSGAYSWPETTSEDINNAGKLGQVVPVFPGIRATLLRRIIGKHHREFATRQLQDAHEFLEYLFGLVEKDSLNKAPISFHHETLKKDFSVGCPVQAYQFAVEERVECGISHCVKYTDTRGYTLTVLVPLEAAINMSDVNNFLSIPEETRNKMKPEEVVRPKIPLHSCINNSFADMRIDDWISPATQPPGQKTFALCRRRLKTFPEFLCFHLARFTLAADWTPKKLDVEIVLNEECASINNDEEYLRKLNDFRLDLTCFGTSGGLQAGETAMPDINMDAVVVKVDPDKEIMAGLMEMGFPYEGCRKACIKTQNSGLKAAMNWVMDHMSDPDFETPEPENMDVSTAQSKSGVDDASVEMLIAMGLTKQQATKALRKCKNNLEAAADWALSNPDDLNAPDSPNPATFAGDNSQITSDNAPLSTGVPKYKLVALVSHMGKTTNDGHYVTHVRRGALSHGIPNLPIKSLPEKCQTPSASSDDEWIIFNDDKVAKSARPPFGFAYLYIFKRLDAVSE